MQTNYSKIYILIKEHVDIGHALLACAHGSLMCYLKFRYDPSFEEYLKNSFRKCVCKVNDKEFEDAKKYDDYVIVTESALSGMETALVFKPRLEWSKAFQFYRLWKDNFKMNKDKYVPFDTSKLENQTALDVLNKEKAIDREIISSINIPISFENQEKAINIVKESLDKASVTYTPKSLREEDLRDRKLFDESFNHAFKNHKP